MKKKSILAMFLAAGMLFSACGGTQASGTTDGTESIALEDSTQLAGGGSSSGKVELTVWGAEEDQELLTGGLTAAAGGIAAALIFGYLASVFFKGKRRG